MDRNLEPPFGGEAGLSLGTPGPSPTTASARLGTDGAQYPRARRLLATEGSFEKPDVGIGVSADDPGSAREYLAGTGTVVHLSSMPTPLRQPPTPQLGVVAF